MINYLENDQLLGVPLADSSTGKEQAVAVYECLQEWGLTNCVKAMCFDTTALNTGRLNGACTILEQMLDKELFYFACRHHILEVLLRGVFDVKLGSTTGPHPDLFKKFEKAWPNIDKTKYDLGISNKNVEKHITSQFITDITADFKSKLAEFQPRDDYKELLELVLVFIGTLDGREVGFKTLGAISHARWMAKAIYCLKIYLFRGQFQLTVKELSALEAICIFLVRIYCQAWFNSPKAHMAPYQDLKLLERLIEFQDIDKEIAERGLVVAECRKLYPDASKSTLCKPL
ncbi:hypothetical protein M8J76_015698 [Diaphorina citri]|nr:hypothetical protein M8J76_015698 [Diaphorina citri]